MRYKQWIGLIVALILLIITGVWGLNQSITSKKNLAMLGSSLRQIDDKPVGKYIAEIDVNGVISSVAPDILFNDSVFNLSTLNDYVDELIEDESNKGILLNIDSPGGEVYPTDVFYQKLMEYKAKTGRPIYVYVGSMAASGGYYLASAGDKIFADRSSWLGSIGVYMQFIDTTKLEEKIGIKLFMVKAGKNKGMGSSSSKMTKEQKDIFQGLVDDAYDTFTQVVSKGRNMNIEKVRKLSDGRIYTAKQAVQNGLLDEISTKEIATKKLAKAVKDPDIEIYPYSPEGSYWKRFLNIYKEVKPKSDAEVLRDVIVDGKSGVLMYHAK